MTSNEGKTQGDKLRETMVKKHGSHDAWLEYLRNNGKKGGSKLKEGPFSYNRELASKAGKKGGENSKRGKAHNDNDKEQ